jgi:hypothetical protein
MAVLPQELRQQLSKYTFDDAEVMQDCMFFFLRRFLVVDVYFFFVFYIFHPSYSYLNE